MLRPVYVSAYSDLFRHSNRKGILVDVASVEGIDAVIRSKIVGEVKYC